MIYLIEHPERCHVKADSVKEAVRFAAEYLDWSSYEFWDEWDHIPEAERECESEWDLMEKYCLPHVEAKLLPGDHKVQISFDLREDAPVGYEPHFAPQCNDVYIPCAVLDEIHENPEVVCAERWAP